MKYVIGNWKMFPKTIQEGVSILDAIRKVAKKAATQNVEVVMCPPMPFLSALGEKYASAVHFGVQDVSFYKEEARTGSVSVAHVRSAAASYVILGHSEMRAQGESDFDIARKIQAAVKGGLRVVLCVGERVRDADGACFLEVEKQLRECLIDFPVTKTGQLRIAYEPVWAVGKDAVAAAAPREFNEMSMLIRRVLAEHFGKTRAFRIPILYGGSVDAKNVETYMHIADGVLVGRKSLVPKDFTAFMLCAMECAHK